MMKKTTRTHGFSLLELLLSVFVFATLLMAVFGMMQYFAQRELARASTKYMATVADAMSQILDNVNSFNALYTAASNNGGVYVLSADTANSAPAQDNIAKGFTAGTGPSSAYIQKSRLLNESFRSANSPLRTPVSIILRIANDPTGKRGFDILIVTNTARPDDIVRMAAGIAGEAGGSLRTYGGKAAGRINSAYGSWSIPLSTLAGTTWYTSLPATLDSSDDGSFLTYYRYANIDDKSGDYLYRRPQTDPSLNTMYGSFNIGGNDIVGADDLTIGNHPNGRALSVSDPKPAPAACDGNVLCVNGTTALKGSGTIGGVLITNGSALVADSINANEMRIQNGLQPAQRAEYRAENLLVVDGTGNAQDTIEVGDNAHFRDGGTVQGANFQAMSIVNATMPEDGAFQTDNLTNNRRITSSSIDANRLNVTDQLKAGQVVGGPVTVSGRTGVIDITNVQDIEYGSQALPRSISTPVMHVKTLNVQSFGACGSGCGQ